MNVFLARSRSLLLSVLVVCNWHWCCPSISSSHPKNSRNTGFLSMQFPTPNHHFLGKILKFVHSLTHSLWLDTVIQSPVTIKLYCVSSQPSERILARFVRGKTIFVFSRVNVKKMKCLKWIQSIQPVRAHTHRWRSIWARCNLDCTSWPLGAACTHFAPNQKS